MIITATMKVHWLLKSVLLPNIVAPANDFWPFRVLEMAMQPALNLVVCAAILAVAVLLLALVELVILAFGVFYLLRWKKGQRLSLLPENEIAMLQGPVPGKPESPVQDLVPATPAGNPSLEKVNKTAEGSPMDDENETAEIIQGGASLPHIVISTHLIPEIYDYVTDFLQEEGQENEAGGLFVGKIRQHNGTPTFQVTGFIPAGPKADFSAGSILFDTEWQTNILTAMRIEDPSLTDLGMIHRHPGQFDECSGGDQADDRKTVQASPCKALLFGIITIGNSERDASSVYYKDFKFDFFVMSEATGFKYAKVLPAFENLPPVKASAPLIALCGNGRSPGEFYDFAVLRNLGAKVLVRSVVQNQTPAVLCTITPKEMESEINVLCEECGALQVFVDTRDGRTQKFHGPWEQSETGRHIWLSHLVFSILANSQLEANHSPYKPLQSES